MPRGGSRNGTQGKGYSNRTDLGGQNVVSPRPSATGQIPIQAAPGQAYGAGAAQKASQAIVPMGGAPTGGAPMQPQGQSSPTPVTPMFAPTAFPNQPVTAGVANSPGAGPEALGLEQGIPLQYQTAKSQIQQLAADPNASPAMQYLASRINGAF